MPNFLIHIISDLILTGIFFITQKHISKTKNINIKKIIIQTILSKTIDIDHLIANPIFQPNRCSINFHPLHSWFVYPIYLIGSIWGKYKYFFIATILHLVLDYLDCFF